MRQFLSFAIALAGVLQSNAQDQKPLAMRVMTWNMESSFPGSKISSDAAKLRDQMAEKGHVHLWGLSEVSGKKDAQLFVEGAVAGAKRAKVDTTYKLILGNTGTREPADPERHDRLAILFDLQHFEQVGQPYELLEFVGSDVTRRAPLVVNLRERSSGVEFIFLVVHFTSGNADHRAMQCGLLSAFAKKLDSPLIAVGDFNIRFSSIRSHQWGKVRGDEGFRDNASWDNLFKDGVLEWIRPRYLVRTQDGYDSVLDFVMVANRPKTWFARSTILEREGNKPAVESEFRDDEQGTDHRPVQAYFTTDITTVPKLEVPKHPALEPESTTELRIIAMLVDPVGDDWKSETVTIANPGKENVSLKGWILHDRSGNTYSFKSTAEIAGGHTMSISVKRLPLDNDRYEEIRLIDPTGKTVDLFSYGPEDVKAGEFLTK